MSSKEYKSYGQVRLLIYVLTFMVGTFGWSLFLLILMRIIPLLRFVSRNVMLDFGVLLVLGGLTAFWVLNIYLIVPMLTTLNSSGFILKDLIYRRNKELNVTWPEIIRATNLGFGLYVTVKAYNGEYYRILFGRDTEDYQNLASELRQGQLNSL